MKKVLYCFLAQIGLFTVAHGYIEECGVEHNTCITTALTAGYVFKRDCLFQEIYGHGIVNVLTADGCYYFSNPWGLGAKISYWRASGRTTFVGKRSHVQEVPVTFYLRRLKEFRCRLSAYASLGGGFIWMQEKSCLGKIKHTYGIGEAEIGMSWPFWWCGSMTGAFRYLFPRQCFRRQKIDVGGFDLRAGFEFKF